MAQTYNTAATESDLLNKEDERCIGGLTPADSDELDRLFRVISEAEEISATMRELIKLYKPRAEQVHDRLKVKTLTSRKAIEKLVSQLSDLVHQMEEYKEGIQKQGEIVEEARREVGVVCMRAMKGFYVDGKAVMCESAE